MPNLAVPDGYFQNVQRHVGDGLEGIHVQFTMAVKFEIVQIRCDMDSIADWNDRLHKLLSRPSTRSKFSF
jgi:hypothetical protein